MTRVSAVAGAIAIVSAGAVLAAFERDASRVRAEIGQLRGQVPADRVRGLEAEAEAWSRSRLLPTRSATLGVDIAASASPPDFGRIRDGLIGLLETKPAFGAAWQSLAAVSLLLGKPVADVLPWVRMSAMTTPSQGSVMMQRAVLGLERWPDLPEPDRRVVLRDVVMTAASRAEAIQVAVYRDTLARLDRDTAAQIRRAIGDWQPDGDVALKRIDGR